VNQAAEVDLAGVAVRRHAHDLEFAVEHLESEILGEGAVDPAEGIGVVKLLNGVNASVFTIAEKGRSVLALAVDAQDGGFAAESAQVIGAAGVGQMMRHGKEGGAGGGDTHLAHEIQDSPTVAPEEAIAVEQRVQRPVGRIPVAPREMPAAGIAETKGGKRKGHGIDVRGGNAGGFQAITGGVQRPAPFGVLVPQETLLLRGAH
jgi:hypothetical protein